MLSISQVSELEEIVGCEPQNKPDMNLSECLDGYLDGNAFNAEHPCKNCPVGKARRRDFSRNTHTAASRQFRVY